MDNQFSPSEPNQTPFEPNQTSFEPNQTSFEPENADFKVTETIKDAKHHFSKIGFFYLIGALLIVIIQSITVAIASNINPNLLSNINAAMLLSMIPMYAIAMPLMMFLIHKFVPASHIEKKKMTVGQWFMAFFICYAGMYLSNLVGLFLTNVIGIVKGSPVQNDILNIATGTNIWFNIIVMVVLAPIFEEFIFRKFLIDRTVKYGEGISIVFSGLLFGLFHGNLNQFAYAFVLGLLFGFIYVKTGNVKYSIFLHMIINFMGSVLSVAIMNILDLDALMEASASPEALMPYAMAHLPQLMVYAVYLLITFGFVITGIVLFIAKSKQFRCMPGKIVIPKGKRFSTTILNVGMILYLIYWIVTIIVQLFQS